MFFQQFGHLGGDWRRNRHGAGENGSVQRGREFGSLRIEATHNFGDIMPV